MNKTSNHKTIIEIATPKIIEIAQLKYPKRSRDGAIGITALRNSIAMHGLHQPIVVDSRYRIISGIRRVKACIKLGHTHIPAISLNQAA